MSIGGRLFLGKSPGSLRFIRFVGNAGIFRESYSLDVKNKLREWKNKKKND